VGRTVIWILEYLFWRILKEERLHVSIPYARRVQFSATTNRRNPGSSLT
jgi:hypothetical protein